MGWFFCNSVCFIITKKVCYGQILIRKISPFQGRIYLVEIENILKIQNQLLHVGLIVGIAPYKKKFVIAKFMWKVRVRSEYGRLYYFLYSEAMSSL